MAAATASPTKEHSAERQDDISSGSSSTATSKQMILRIKRKRKQDPIDALIIQQNERRQKRRSIVLPGADSHTPEESPAAASRGVFRLAETVSLSSFSDPVAAEKLHQKITALSRNGALKTKPCVPSKLSQSMYLPAVSSMLSDTGKDDAAEPAEDKLARSTASLGASGRSTPSIRPKDRIKAIASDQIDREKDRQARSRSSTPSGMRFKVIQKEHGAGKGLRRSGSFSNRALRGGSFGTARTWQADRPPEIRSKKEKEAEAVFGKIIDAEADSRKRSSSRNTKSNSKLPVATQDEDMAKLDSKFAEMLGDYLRSNDIEPSQEIDNLAEPQSHDTQNAAASSSSTEDSESEDDDYVYDIYYRDMAPSRAAPQGSAETGLQPLIVPGHEKQTTSYSEIPDSMTIPRIMGGEVVPPEASMNAVVARLEGFEDSEDEAEHAQEDGGFESFDEGEDEDSNDEGFYRNDYPEQELPDDDLDYDFGSADEDGAEESDNDRYALSDSSY